MSLRDELRASAGAPQRQGQLRGEGRRGPLTLTQTPPANGYSYEMMRDIDEAVLRARFDGDVHAIVLAGEGEVLHAGADISMLDSVTPTFKYAFCLHANETMLRTSTRRRS